MKRQRKQLVLLILFLLLLAGGYLGLKKYNEAEADKEAESMEYAIDIDVSEITALSYSYEGMEYTFVQEENNWQYEKDKTLTLMQSRLNAMAEKLARLEIKSQIENVTDMSVYGLTDPKQVITVQAAGTTYKIEMGDYNAMSGFDYISINGSNVVYAVKTDLGDAFGYTLEDLIEEAEEETAEETDAEGVETE